MKLIKGDKLTAEQTKLVLQAFPYRHTIENASREKFFYDNSVGLFKMPIMERITDKQWLQQNAFYFVNSGKRLAKIGYCEPSCLAN
jgi:hypothetical protein